MTLMTSSLIFLALIRVFWPANRQLFLSVSCGLAGASALITHVLRTPLLHGESLFSWQLVYRGAFQHDQVFQ